MDAPQLLPSQCATSAPPIEPLRGDDDADAVHGSGTLSQQRSGGGALARRFGDARHFVQHAMMPPRPMSAASTLMLMTPAPVSSIAALNLTSTPAVDHLEFRRPSSAAAHRGASAEAPNHHTRPYSAMSTGSDASAHKSLRPSSALSVTTRDINTTVGSLMQAIADRESQVSSPKSSTASVRIRRKDQRSGKKKRDAEDSVFALTGVTLDDAHDERQAPDDHAATGDHALDTVRKDEAKPLPYFLTRSGTWQRLWRTKADLERERLHAAEEQLRATGRSTVSHYHVVVQQSAASSYASGMIDEEHVGALLCKLRTNDKIAALREDPEKRKLFSAACGALQLAVKREGESVILKRRARSAALLRSASTVGSSTRQAQSPSAAQDASTQKRASHFLALPLSPPKAADHHHHVHYVESADGDSTASDVDEDQERSYFAAASRMTHDIEKQRRGHAALERYEMLRCARLIRAAEDIEKVDVMRSKQFTDVQIEVRVNFFATTAILAAHMGSWLGAIAKRHKQQQHQQLQHPQTDASAATELQHVEHQQLVKGQAPKLQISSRIQRLLNGCQQLIHLRKDAILKACARSIWRMWLACRARIRARRKRISIALVRRFISHRRDTMRFVVAVNHYLDTVRYIQSLWRGTMMLRTLRHDLAIRQMQLFLTRLIKDDVARVANLKAQCRQKECEIVNRKGVPRLVKSQWIAELKKETEADIAASQVRARKAEALRERQDVVTSAVEQALGKKHHDYHQQVGRYAKALASYVREINALRSKRIIVVQRRNRRAKEQQQGGLQHQSSQRASPKHGSYSAQHKPDSSSGTPPLTHRSSFVESARRASSMESARRQTHVQAQIEAFLRGGKIFVAEPSTIRPGGHSVAVSGSTSRGSLRGSGSFNSSPQANDDVMLWAMLKERGIVGHIPIKPIQPFFHSLFHQSEMLQLLEDAKV